MNLPFFKRNANHAALPVRQRLDLREEVLNRTIFSLAMPAVVENLMFTVVFFADTLIVGWLRDENALAAAGLAGTLMFLANSPFHALSIATVSLVSRSWGEHQFDTARRFAGQSVCLSFLLSLIIMLIGLPLANKMLTLMGGSDEVVRLGGQYLRIILYSSLLGFPMIISNGVIRGAGNTKTPMRITLTMNLVNIIVSVILVFGLGSAPALGLAGAGWGTMIARAVGGLISLGLLARVHSTVHVPLKYFVRWEQSVVRRIFRLASPVMIERMLSSGSHVVFMGIVALLGTTALAAHNIALRVESLAFMPGFGISVAVTTIVGQALGANRSHIAEMTVRRTLFWSGIFMSALGLIFIVFARQVVVVFGGTPEVLRLAGIVLQISALEHPLMAFVMILSGGLRGAGDTRSSLYVTLVCIFLFRFATVYLFGITFGWGLPGVWLATAVDWGGRSLGLWYVFRRGVWKIIHERERLSTLESVQ